MATKLAADYKWRSSEIRAMAELISYGDGAEAHVNTRRSTDITVLRKILEMQAMEVRFTRIRMQGCP